MQIKRKIKNILRNVEKIVLAQVINNFQTTTLIIFFLLLWMLLSYCYKIYNIYNSLNKIKKGQVDSKFYVESYKKKF